MNPIPEGSFAEIEVAVRTERQPGRSPTRRGEGELGDGTRRRDPADSTTSRSMGDWIRENLGEPEIAIGADRQSAIGGTSQESRELGDGTQGRDPANPKIGEIRGEPEVAV